MDFVVKTSVLDAVSMNPLAAYEIIQLDKLVVFY